MSRPLRVLVADDESRLRELLVRELGRKGHEVEGWATARRRWRGCASARTTSSSST